MSAPPSAEGPNPSAAPHHRGSVFWPSKVIKAPGRATPGLPDKCQCWSCPDGSFWEPAVPCPSAQHPLWPGSLLISSFSIPTKGNPIDLIYHCSSVNDWRKYYLLMTRNFEFFPPKYIGWVILLSRFSKQSCFHSPKILGGHSLG